MLKRIILIPVIVAAGLTLAGCQPGSDGAAANNAAANNTSSAEANNNTAYAQTNSASQSTNASEGAPTGGTCGTIAGIQCSSASDFCKTPVGQCDVADAQGTCTRRPEVCTREFRPVCGCNGTTYSNACAASAAGVNVRAEGECAGY